MRGIYREDGCKWVVAILSDQTTAKGRTVTLLIQEIIRDPRPSVRKMYPGDEFEVFAASGYEHLAGWTLEPLP